MTYSFALFLVFLLVQQKQSFFFFFSNHLSVEFGGRGKVYIILILLNLLVMA